MLTRDLLMFRVRLGKIRPAFVDVSRPDLAALAQDLVELAGGAAGKTRGELDEELEARVRHHPRLKVARGLCKLLLDRALFEEPREEVAGLRRESFAAAARVLRSLAEGTSLEEYQQRLEAALGRPLEGVREALYSDLPEQRRLLEWKPLSARALLERYNLALAQGLVLHSSGLTLRAEAPELLRVRRVLRWLKFCRLVAEVLRHGRDWTIEVEGPAAILEMQKKYGLQLAVFLGVVPVLRHWRLEARVQLPRRERLLLELSDEDPLVSAHDEGLGHIPPEVAQVAGKFRDDALWELDLTPEPRHVGANDLCVPDLRFRNRKTGREVCFELFHRWHHHALLRRLASLRARPDPGLYLGVDRPLAKRPELAEALEGCEQVMPFNTFPSERKIREILRRFETSGQKLL
jgi:uncharacterized protein